MPLPATVQALDGLVLPQRFAQCSKTGGKWLKQAPMWTSASGIFYKMDIWKLSLIDKLVGQQYSDTANTHFYKLGAYNNIDFKTSVTLGDVRIGPRHLQHAQLAQPGRRSASTTRRPDRRRQCSRSGEPRPSLDQYYFQPSRSYQMSLTARF